MFRWVFAQTLMGAALAAVLAAGPAPAMGQEQTLNLRDADIHAFINDVSMMTGRTFIVDPRVTGKVTVVSREPVSKAETFQIFRATLAVHGYSVISTASGAYKIVPEETAAQQPGPVGADSATGTQFVTEVIPLDTVDPVAVLNMIKPLVNQEGRALANRGGDAVIVVDTADNLKRIRKVVDKIDTDTSVSEAVTLNNTPAQDMADVLTAMTEQDQGESPRQAVTIVPVSGSNTVIIKGEKKMVARLADTARDLDKRNKTRNDLKVIYLEHAAAEDLAPILKKVSAAVTGPGGGSGDGDGSAGGGRANIAFDKATNSLVISAEPDMQATLASVIERLDVRRAQVLVEAIIVEVSDTAARDLGLQFVLSGSEGSQIPFTVANYSNTAPNILAATGAIALDRETQGDSAVLDELRSNAINSLLGFNGFGVGAGGITDNGTLFGVIVNALSEDRNSNVLSTPSVMTMDNEEASIIVGQEIPITTGETLGSDNNNPFRTVERRDVGVQLDVQPQINEGNTVRLFIRQEVSSVAGPVSENFEELITNKRQIETTVVVDHGEIVVLGGLIESDEQVSVNKVPFLGDIPVLGRAFQSESKSRQRTNLMVFLRPTIVRGAEDVRAVTEQKYNYMRAEQLLRDGQNTGLNRFIKETMGATPPGAGASGKAGAEAPSAANGGSDD